MLFRSAGAGHRGRGALRAATVRGRLQHRVVELALLMLGRFAAGVLLDARGLRRAEQFAGLAARLRRGGKLLRAFGLGRHRRNQLSVLSC